MLFKKFFRGERERTFHCFLFKLWVVKGQHPKWQLTTDMILKQHLENPVCFEELD